MIGLNIVEPTDRPIGIFCIGAHSDDIEIGAGGAILELARRYPTARIAWHVLAARGARADEARKSAAIFTEGYSHAEVHIHEFTDGSLRLSTVVTAGRSDWSVSRSLVARVR